MPDFNSQNTDAENNKPVPKSVSRDNDLTINGSRGVQDWAADDPRDTTAGKRQKAAEIRTSKISGGI